MPLVCILPGGVRIEQYWKDHDPPHFHAIRASEEVLIRIADLSIYAGSLGQSALRDVMVWARDHRAALALNWVDARAGLTIERIPYP